jgi:hypothetical protein
VPPNARAAAEGVAVASDGTVYANGTIQSGRLPIVTVARSDDAGRTWTRTLQFRSWPPGTTYVAAGPLAVDPTNPAVVLAVVAAGDSGGIPSCVRLLKTTNRGGRGRRSTVGLCQQEGVVLLARRGRRRILRVVEVRDDGADQAPTLVVEDVP